jgi:MurNAc alpha-1-phosphate uridylyltransferase
MRAMILAAGRGERLRPITDTTPKPMVEVKGQPLIYHHLDKLSKSGFREVVINLGHLGHVIKESVGTGDRWGVNISYSQEPEGALETGGGIKQAIPLLGKAPFAMVNGDIFCDFSFHRLRSIKCDHAHLVLIPVPAWRNEGDFALQKGKVENSGDPLYTFSGISVYNPRFFDNAPDGRWSIVPLLRKTIDNHLVTGEIFTGSWNDIGTIQRLNNLEG